MISEVGKRWVEAGKRLAINPEDKVACPKCFHEYLKVRDFRSQSNPASLERELYCEVCKANNFLRLTRPE